MPFEVGDDSADGDGVDRGGILEPGVFEGELGHSVDLPGDPLGGFMDRLRRTWSEESAVRMPGGLEAMAEVGVDVRGGERAEMEPQADPLIDRTIASDPGPQFRLADQYQGQ